MKSIAIIFCVTFSFIAKSQTKNDTLLIKEATLNYVEGFYTSDAERVKKAVHPELAKRLLIQDKDHPAVNSMSASELVLSASKYKKGEAGDPFKATINVYDINSNIATAKVATNKFKFIDYLHLIKINNEWKIINVLWGFTK